MPGQIIYPSIGPAVAISQLTVADAGNSSTTPLGAGASFTGTPFDAFQGFAFVDILVFSDQSSAANGLKIEFSTDAVNWDDASVTQYVSGGASPNAGNVFGCGIRSRYYRIVYTNGSTPQGAFRLYTTARPVSPVADVVDNTLSPPLHAHGLMVRAAILGFSTAGGGTFVDVKVNPSGSLQVGGAVTASGDAAQGASAIGLAGLLSQSRVDIAPPSPSDDTVIPLSLNQGGRLRTIAASEEDDSAWDDVHLPDPFNVRVSASGFDVVNQITIDNAWES